MRRRTWLDCPREDCDGEIRVHYQIDNDEVAEVVDEDGRFNCTCLLERKDWQRLESENQEKMFYAAKMLRDS